jgi:hypothetical protein
MTAEAHTRERPDPRTGGVLGTALTAALLFAGLVLPLLGPLLALASPLPLVLQRLRSGPGGAVLASVLSASFVALAFSPGQALVFLALLAAPGLLLGEAMARGRGLARGAAWAFGLVSVEIGVLLLLDGAHMAEAALLPFEHFRSPEVLEALRAAGWGPENVEQWVELSTLWHGVLSVVYPAAFLIAGAVGVLVNAALLRAYLVRRDPGWLEGGEFESIHWPLGLAAVFVVGGASVLVSPLRPVAYNVLLLVAFFYVLQGLAVAAFYARRLAAPPLLRWGLMALVLLNPWAPQILALLGLFDTWIDFRRWADPPAQAGS